MKQLKQLQQGDVNITKISGLPTDCKTINTDIVREGEATGHAHRIIGTDFQLCQQGQLILARIMSGDCAIVHEEHKTIKLPQGNYAFSPTVEYDHFTERSRMVRD